MNLVPEDKEEELKKILSAASEGISAGYVHVRLEGELVEYKTVEHIEALIQSGPIPNSIYRHYKGSLYQVVCCAVMESSMEPVVVYTPVVNFNIRYVRPLREWDEDLPGTGKRYERVDAGVERQIRNSRRARG